MPSIEVGEEKVKVGSIGSERVLPPFRFLAERHKPAAPLEDQSLDDFVTVLNTNVIGV
jgi:hypothetical protein